MPDWILPLGNGASVVAFVGLFYWLLSRGSIITKGELERTVALKDAQLELIRQAAEIRAQHATDLQEIGRTQLEILASLDRMFEDA